jgi:hypothetical protein
MKLKVEIKEFEPGKFYWVIYKRFDFFFWERVLGLYDTKEEASAVAVKMLEDESKRRKHKKEKPVYFELQNGMVVRSE